MLPVGPIAQGLPIRHRRRFTMYNLYCLDTGWDNEPARAMCFPISPQDSVLCAHITKAVSSSTSLHTRPHFDPPHETTTDL